ncbi:hypothetical protein BGW36DRAFT_395126 [Talaromyces proteolyticus]|uniref:C2H2-type domain-containing protein n=1 Tax=Talaromyces proteolyticus TaxID=1131652 RepID=A0AAD4PZD9_9EURO|nr:uncharacterized protein BGW36DRAFT_395126 [Talaromyces proteolyticus]KAH8702500.1 hypothetical protein BGW36DRAFT_395126 [Talaromyces proteolyticus]
MAKRCRRESVDSFESSISTTPHLHTPTRRSSSRTPPAKITTSLHMAADNHAKVMHCSLPPHRETISFASYDEYERHYLQTHVNRCSECAKNFPTQHFLHLHIEENHDPLILARRDRDEKTFGCFVEGCDRKCSTPQKRRRHLIDKHMFPRNYNFFIVNDGIDKQNSLLRPSNGQRRRVSTTQSPQEGRLRNRRTSVDVLHAAEAKPSKTSESDDGGVDTLVSSMSALSFVPVSVTRRSDFHNKTGQG